MSMSGSGALVRRHVEEIVNQQALDVVEEIYQPDLTFIDPFAPGGAVHGQDGLKAFLQAIYHAVPDLRFTVKHTFEDGAIAGWHGRVAGTLQHDLGGIPGQGQHFDVPLCEVFKVDDGKVAEVWVYLETATLLQQVGVLPSPQGAEEQGGDPSGQER